MRALGLMSGTSLDGIDAALVDIVPRGKGYDIRPVRFECAPFARDLHEALVAALPPRRPAQADVAALDRELGTAFAEVARRVAAGQPVDFAASHGLTLFHRGEAGETIQIGSPYRLRDALRASVVYDFRRADCAAGGHGAPLVPYVDGLLFAASDRNTVALNLGGIANVTALPAGGDPALARAWDTGPGNMLMDAFVRQRTDGRERLDTGGALAARGVVREPVVRELLGREAPFLALPPPKSTGRERFGEGLLAAQADLLEPLTLEDGCATLAAFTVETIALALEAYGPARATVIASGGGTHNATLMRALARRLAGDGHVLETSAAFGVDPDAKEAIAFAVLGYETLRGRPASVPSATGATHAALLGSIVPHALEALLAKMRAECAANAAA